MTGTLRILAQGGALYPYEGWRLSGLFIEKIAGLMLYSRHRFIFWYSMMYFGEVFYNENVVSGSSKYLITDLLHGF